MLGVPGVTVLLLKLLLVLGWLRMLRGRCGLCPCPGVCVCVACGPRAGDCPAPPDEAEGAARRAREDDEGRCTGVPSGSATLLRPRAIPLPLPGVVGASVSCAADEPDWPPCARCDGYGEDDDDNDDDVVLPAGVDAPLCCACADAAATAERVSGGVSTASPRPGPDSPSSSGVLARLASRDRLAAAAAGLLVPLRPTQYRMSWSA